MGEETMVYLFYITVGAVLGFFIFGPIGVFSGGFLGFLYGTGELHRKKNEELITKRIEELEKEIHELKNSNR